jgi:ectoine hydroxylase-related dioxygenase (phytanoyl-CoA dioxygenase family)
VIDQVNFKLPRMGTCFPYHQDERFVTGVGGERLRRFGGVNLVIALDASDEENGGFEVLGGTHLGPLSTDPYVAGQMNRGVFDESRRAIPALCPGDAVLFHPRLAHGSGPNPSERRRRLVTLWFVAGKSA